MLSLHLLGKPSKKKLVYMVKVAEKGLSELELENDLNEPMLSGKKGDELGSETFEAHFTAIEMEALKERAPQEEQKDVVTLETFGLPPVATKVSLGTDGGEAQSTLVKVQNETSDDTQPITNKDEENTLQKVNILSIVYFYVKYYCVFHNFIVCTCSCGGLPKAGLIKLKSSDMSCTKFV